MSFTTSHISVWLDLVGIYFKRNAVFVIPFCSLPLNNCNFTEGTAALKEIANKLATSLLSTVHERLVVPPGAIPRAELSAVEFVEILLSQRTERGGVGDPTEVPSVTKAATKSFKLLEDKFVVMGVAPSKVVKL